MVQFEIKRTRKTKIESLHRLRVDSVFTFPALSFQGDGATRDGVTVGLGLAVRRGILVGRELADAAVTRRSERDGLSDFIQ